MQKHSKTKLPWFSCRLRHSTRKRSGFILQHSRAHTGHNDIEVLAVVLYSILSLHNIVLAAYSFFGLPDMVKNLWKTWGCVPDCMLRQFCLYYVFRLWEVCACGPWLGWHCCLVLRCCACGTCGSDYCV